MSCPPKFKPCPAHDKFMAEFRPQPLTPMPPLNPPNDFIFTEHHLLCDELIDIDMASVERRIQQMWMKHDGNDLEMPKGYARMSDTPSDWLSDIDDSWDHIEALSAAVRRAADIIDDVNEPNGAASNVNDAPSTSTRPTPPVAQQPQQPPPHVVGNKAESAAVSSSVNVMHTLMTRAMTEQLQLADGNALVEFCTSADGASLLSSKAIDIRPTRMHHLVEANPMVAVEMYLLVCKNKHNDEITSFFSSLLNMDLSVHSMEVINRLTTLVEMPPEFVKLYARQCIQSCRSLGHVNVSQQRRIVRMVCVFLSSLIRHELIDNAMSELNIEIRTFCLEFSAVKEAQALYQTITVKCANANEQQGRD